jgi:MaoC like domain
VNTNPDFGTNPQTPWSIVARNLPEHANNSIHTDEGARAAGFERALVAGVTSYAYCLHPVIEHFGLGWLSTGEAEVRFRSPVFDGDQVSFPLKTIGNGFQERDDRNPTGGEDGVEVEALVDRSSRPLVTVSAWRNHRAQNPYPSGASRPGDQLETVQLVLEGEYGSEYAQRSGNHEDQCAKAGLVHPGVWPALGNYVFHRQLARGSWIHTRSIVRQFAAVADGAEAEVFSSVIERFHRGGERAIADVIIRVEGKVVAAIEHEAIVDLSLR